MLVRQTVKERKKINKESEREREGGIVGSEQGYQVPKKQKRPNFQNGRRSNLDQIKVKFTKKI